MKMRTKKRISLVCMFVLLLSSIISHSPRISNAKDYTSLGCVSWVKDRALEKLGISLPSTGLNEYGLYGASAYWTNLTGYNKGSTPASNSLAVWKFNNGTDGQDGKYGHVAFVEEVNGDQVTVTEGGCAGYSYGGHTGVIHRTQSSSKMATLGGCSSFLGYIYLSGDPGNNPQGCVDVVTGGQGTVYVGGWAFDRDDTNTSIDVHVYIGGDASSGEGHAITANGARDDVNSAYSIGGSHGFSESILTNKRGTQDIFIYLINIGGGENVLLGKHTATISESTPAVTPAPTITPSIAPTPSQAPSASSTPGSSNSAIAKDFTVTQYICTQDDNAIIYCSFSHDKNYTLNGAGWSLYDENNTVLIGDSWDKTLTSKTVNTVVDIKKDKNYSLQKGKKYKIQLYNIYNAEKLYAKTIEFIAEKNEIQFNPTTLVSTGANSAVLSCNYVNLLQQPVPIIKLFIYGSNGELLGSKEYNYDGEEPRFSSAKMDTSECISLSSGIQYTCKMSITLNGKTYTSDSFAFKIGDSSSPSTTATPDPTSFPSDIDDESGYDTPRIPAFSLKRLKAGFKLTVKKQSGMSWYDIRYSLKKSMRPYKTRTIFQDHSSSIKIKNLKRKKKYYVMVRTHGNSMDSSWSGIRVVTTK